MQPPTCHGVRIRTKEDALVILHAVSLRLLGMVTRRLDTNERRAIQPGDVFVWEERGASSDSTGMGIERWTDSIQWGPSRVRDEFLYYQQRRPPSAQADASSTDSEGTRATPLHGPPLHKQTYSAWVETPTGRRKWHLIAYFHQETFHRLYDVREHPYYHALAAIRIPEGIYQSARTTRSRRRRHLRHLPRGPGGQTANVPPGRKTLPPLDSLSTILTPPRHVIDQIALNSIPLFL